MARSQPNEIPLTHRGHAKMAGPTGTRHLHENPSWSNTGAAPADDHMHRDQKKAQGFWYDKDVWKRSSLTTLTCLIGCSIGDFTMIIYLQTFHPETPMWLQMVLAVLAGLLTSIALETWILRSRENLMWKSALKMALSMSMISIVGMEVVMNLTDFMITGGKAQLSSIRYWFAFIPAAIAGFLAPLPYNYYQLKKHNRSHH